MAKFLNVSINSASCSVAAAVSMYRPSAMSAFMLASWPWLSFSFTSASSFFRANSAVRLFSPVSWAFCSMWAIYRWTVSQVLYFRAPPPGGTSVSSTPSWVSCWTLRHPLKPSIWAITPVLDHSGTVPVRTAGFSAFGFFGAAFFAAVFFCSATGGGPLSRPGGGGPPVSFFLPASVSHFDPLRPARLSPPLGGINSGGVFAMRNVTGPKIFCFMGKNTGLSLPRVGFRPRKDPRRGWPPISRACWPAVRPPTMPMDGGGVKG